MDNDGWEEEDRREGKKKRNEDGKSSISWKSIGFLFGMFVLGQNNILNY